MIGCELLIFEMRHNGRSDSDVSATYSIVQVIFRHLNVINKTHCHKISNDVTESAGVVERAAAISR